MVAGRCQCFRCRMLDKCVWVVWRVGVIVVRGGLVLILGRVDSVGSSDEIEWGWFSLWVSYRWRTSGCDGGCGLWSCVLVILCCCWCGGVVFCEMRRRSGGDAVVVGGSGGSHYRWWRVRWYTWVEVGVWCVGVGIGSSSGGGLR